MRAARAARLFSLFNQSDHCFLVLSLPLPSSLLKLPNDYGNGNHEKTKSAYLTSKTKISARSARRHVRFSFRNLKSCGGRQHKVLNYIFSKNF